MPNYGFVTSLVALGLSPESLRYLFDLFGIEYMQVNCQFYDFSLTEPYPTFQLAVELRKLWKKSQEEFMVLMYEFKVPVKVIGGKVVDADDVVDNVNIINLSNVVDNVNIIKVSTNKRAAESENPPKRMRCPQTSPKKVTAYRNSTFARKALKVPKTKRCIIKYNKQRDTEGKIVRVIRHLVTCLDDLMPEYTFEMQSSEITAKVPVIAVVDEENTSQYPSLLITNNLHSQVMYSLTTIAILNTDYELERCLINLSLEIFQKIREIILEQAKKIAV
jgi:hypothetical protein